MGSMRIAAAAAIAAAAVAVVGGTGSAQAAPNGIENGNAIAAVLYGQANPSGRLPQTFPKSLADMPTKTPEQYPGKDGTTIYSEGLKVGYRWFDSQRIEPLFPFGYGLSYTSFRYSGLKVKARRTGATVSFAVKNTGARRGTDVEQLQLDLAEALQRCGAAAAVASLRRPT
jgi:beta-glucosidase